MEQAKTALEAETSALVANGGYSNGEQQANCEAQATAVLGIAEMGLGVLGYNMARIINAVGIPRLLEALS